MPELSLFLNPMFHFMVFRGAIVVLLLSLNSLCCLGQSTQFSEESALRGLTSVANHSIWGSGVSSYDWNKDGWPDVSLCSNGSAPEFFTNNGDGTFNSVSFGITNTSEMRSMVWADYDNDGDADLFVTRWIGPWSLYRNNGNFSFTDVTNISGLGQFTYNLTMGASWSDIDRDGHLDLHIANYNYNDGVTNKLYLSNGNGGFTDFTAQSGVGNGSCTSFQGVFADFDMNGWSDLYLVNDRAMCENALYMNFDGTFSDYSVSSGSNVAFDAMSNTVGDFDNDGDLDIYLSNQNPGNQLLRNNGDITFTNIAVQSAVTVNQFCWGAVWLDQDLDGWQDLFVATSSVDSANGYGYNYFYQNNQNGAFNYTGNSGLEEHFSRSYCAAKADFDNNGSPDLLVSGMEPYLTELWINNSANHRYLKVSLEGTVSNRDGIGSAVRCYSNGQMQLRYTKCGEGHLSQNSQYQIFGLDQATDVDSLTVTWPSGMVDRLYDLATNQTLHVIEGSTSNLVSIPKEQQNRSVICQKGDALVCTAFEVSAWRVYNTSGQVVASSADESVSISHLPTGVYTVIAERNSEVPILRKVLIQ
ncbi:MAG: VCBS repeat-containing protein [Flavobacteriales bacterium]|nr:VCBS repeat-containing protein [Flavobacteriales bacterium]